MKQVVRRPQISGPFDAGTFCTTLPAPTESWAKKPEALELLKKAEASGYSNLDWAVRDPDLACLHGDPEFQKLMVEAARKR